MPKLKGKNVLVTGGAGFIGSHLIDRIISENPAGLVVLDNLSLGKKENLESAQKNFPHLKIYISNAAKYKQTEKIIRKENIEVIFNLAVVPLPASLIHPLSTVNINIGITSVLCELLRKKYYSTLIHFSSSEVYGTAKYVPMDESHPLVPLTPYAASKAACDYIVLSYRNTFGIDTAIVRSFNNFGPRQNSGKYAGIIPIAINRIIFRQPIVIYGNGEQTRDYIYVKDVADATVRIYENKETRGKVINIGMGEKISINRLVKKLLSIMKSEVRVLYKDKRLGDVSMHLADINLARKLIGFKPKVGLEEGLKKTVDWYTGGEKNEN